MMMEVKPNSGPTILIKVFFSRPNSTHDPMSAAQIWYRIRWDSSLISPVLFTDLIDTPFQCINIDFLDLNTHPILNQITTDFV